MKHLFVSPTLVWSFVLHFVGLLYRYCALCVEQPACVDPTVLLASSGSGGNGRFNGGAGVIREIEFRCPMTVGILSERRSTHPYGLDGGAPGSKGVNLLARKGGRLVR